MGLKDGTACPVPRVAASAARLPMDPSAVALHVLRLPGTFTMCCYLQAISYALRLL